MKSWINVIKVCMAMAILLMQSLVYAQQSSDLSNNSGIVPSSGGGGSDNLGFQADLFTGRFSYSVPIKVAPGRQGAEPKLILGYNSASGNGWCGFGWSLDVGYIQRDTRPGVPIKWGFVTITTNIDIPKPNITNYTYITNNLPYPQYDDSKGFIANFGGNGSALVRVSSTNQNPIVYHQQVDMTFLAYNYYTNNHWEVVDKGGNTFYFGEGITNQMEHPITITSNLVAPGQWVFTTNWLQGFSGSTFRWVLNKVIDVNGNETLLKYMTDGGNLYLTNIAYNANINSPNLAATHTVDFVLTNRPDTNIALISGYRVQTRKRLAEIQVKVSGSNVRKYVLNYTTSSSTSRSLLASITEYGSDYSTSLPPVTFNYQVKPLQFGPATNWPCGIIQGNTGAQWGAIRGTDINGAAQVALVDIDADGLPDRIMRKVNSSYTYFAVQKNTGSGFGPYGDFYQWGYVNAPLDSQNLTNNSSWGSTSVGNGTYTYVDFFDINGDGYPDRIMDPGNGPYTNFFVQFNSGIATNTNFSADYFWGPVTNVESTAQSWNSIRYVYNVDMMDMNGDGLPDKINNKAGGPFDRFRVQLNTGSGFQKPVDWMPLDSQGQTSDNWNSITQGDGNHNYQTMMIDVNGDGLADRAMRQVSSPFTNFVVQLNNGVGFEPAEMWGPIYSEDGTGSANFDSPLGSSGSVVRAAFMDINGDGLPDRVMRKLGSPFTNFVVQYNTGSGFGPLITNQWTLDSQGQTSSDWNSPSASGSGDTFVDLMDINGDGLADRIMRKDSSPYTNYVVQLNQGPYPDLLNVVSNGIGGSVQVSYIGSVTLDNRDKGWTNDAWAEGTRSLLPFNVWVVSQVAANNGMGNVSTNTYAFKGGYYSTEEREFRGFAQATVVDPLGTKTITYFHQSGGRDNSALGEYADQTSESKKGMPYRVDVIGSDGTTNKITLNKIEEVLLNSNGWYYPFVSQTITIDYEGLSTYRATAKLLSYDTNTESLIEEADLGEVTNIVMGGQTFTDIGNDAVYIWTSYTNFGRPSDIKITSDSTGITRLREARMVYDSRGNLTASEAWLDTAGNFIATSSRAYDQYGNMTQTVDASGIATTTVYDSIYKQYPVIKAVGIFTNQAAYDPAVGLTSITIDPKGLVLSNVFDVFFRPIATYTSTNAYGSAMLWKAKMTYSLGGIIGGVSYNCIHKQANDAVDTLNGFETYVYMDGIGRTIQIRDESETTGKYRVVNTCYDSRGNQNFQTLSYLEIGSGFTSINGTFLGALTEYDTIGRVFRATSAVQGTFVSGNLTGTVSTGGDTGSPIGAMTTSSFDGNDPWAMVVTDPEGKTKKSYSDAFGRTVKITEVTSAGNYNTTYAFDRLGNPTNVVDNSNNVTTAFYDSLGRKISMTDPDMGTWTYAYDNGGRATQQIDAKGNKVTFDYTDSLGRLVAKRIYNPNGDLVDTITYTYDVSDDPNFAVFKGQVYKVTDKWGYQRASYDVRGRTLKSARFLNINAMEYITQSTYDDADRIQTLTYPGNAAVVQYSYDTAGNLNQVKSLAGTGTQESFYMPQGFDAQGQLVASIDGTGCITTNIYYSNSKRLQRVWTYRGTTNLQDLSYTYDTVSDLKSISDGVYSGTASASISNITYDDLYRPTYLTSTARGLKAYAYDSIGNIQVNQDFGSGSYTYGAKPHAVTNANGINYAYDICGNMTNRGGQTLVYDEENQLIQVTTTNSAVTFGYDNAGQRLWRYGTNGYSIWIGGLYEINNGKILCHVLAGNTRIATFEPLCGGLWSKVIGEKNYYAVATAVAWPMQAERIRWTELGGTWVLVLGICLLLSHGMRIKSYEFRKSIRCSMRWKQAVTILSISAFFWASTPQIQAAPAFDPVFYYYHHDNLGSSTILTDRTGQTVEHYEYSTFGQTSYQNNTSAFPVSNRYTGQVFDDETGLYYYNARYYDPQLGRFIQPDTIVPGASNPQNLNRYSYVNNNPLNSTDPNGHGFLSGLFKVLTTPFINTVLHPFSFSTITSPACLSAIFGADDYINAQLFGQTAATDIAIGRSAAMGVAEIVIGVIMICTGAGVVAGSFMIMAGELSLASLGESMAGNEDVAQYLGWAAWAAGVGATIAGITGDPSSGPPGPTQEMSGDAPPHDTGPRDISPNYQAPPDPLPTIERPQPSFKALSPLKVAGKAGLPLAKYWWQTDLEPGLNDFLNVKLGWDLHSMPPLAKIVIGGLGVGGGFAYYYTGNSLSGSFTIWKFEGYGRGQLIGSAGVESAGYGHLTPSGGNVQLRFEWIPPKSWHW